MAHANFEQLALLLQCLDYPENDIYIHIDKKTNCDRDLLVSAVKYSSVFFTEQVRVNWGGYSIVEATLILLKEATAQECYARYHLISGADFPLRSQKIIHEYFDSKLTLEYISGAYPMESSENRMFDRIRYYYPFQDCFSRNNIMGKILRKGSILVQKQLGINRLKKTNMRFGVGSQFFSITDRFARYVLSQKKQIEKLFSKGFCVDEMFIQWAYLQWENANECYASNRGDHPYIQEIYFDVCRAIDWKRGKPYVYKNEDFEMLMESGCLFARKFDYNTSPELMMRIIEKVKAF